MKLALTVLPLALAGCLAHMPPDKEPAHLRVEWRVGFEEAAREAAALKRPLLLCLVGGDLKDDC